MVNVMRLQQRDDVRRGRLDWNWLIRVSGRSFHCMTGTGCELTQQGNNEELFHQLMGSLLDITELVTTLERQYRCENERRQSESS